MSMIVEGHSISALAREFKMSARTIAKRLEGVPSCGKRGTATLYLMLDAAPAILRGAGRLPAPDADGGEPLDLNQESAKLKKAQREKIELDIAVLRGDLVPSVQISDTWVRFIFACRAKLLSLPTTAAPRVSGLSLRETEIELRDLVNEALDELKDYSPRDYEATGDRVRAAGEDFDFNEAQVTLE